MDPDDPDSYSRPVRMADIDSKSRVDSGSESLLLRPDRDVMLIWAPAFSEAVSSVLSGESLTPPTSTIDVAELEFAVPSFSCQLISL